MFPPSLSTRRTWRRFISKLTRRKCWNTYLVKIPYLSKQNQVRLLLSFQFLSTIGRFRSHEFWIIAFHVDAFFLNPFPTMSKLGWSVVYQKAFTEKPLNLIIRRSYAFSHFLLDRLLSTGVHVRSSLLTLYFRVCTDMVAITVNVVAGSDRFLENRNVHLVRGFCNMSLLQSGYDWFSTRNRMIR